MGNILWRLWLARNILQNPNKELRLEKKSALFSFFMVNKKKISVFLIPSFILSQINKLPESSSLGVSGCSRDRLNNFSFFF